MKARIVATVQHMAEAQIINMVPVDTLARLRQSDPKPEIRAYAIAHEGEAAGNMVGVGKRVMQYFRDAIIALHNRLALGTKIFQRHGATNAHDGRAQIGELVGKALDTIGGKLHDIAAVYIYPEHRQLPLDIASIEAEVQYTDDGQGGLTAVDIGEITGIALSSSSVERPGFAGATLLAAVQAFVDGEGKGKAMTKEELKQAIAEGKFKPSDLFEADAIKTDSVVVEHVKAEKQTEYEFAKRMERTRQSDREEHARIVADYEEKLKTANAAALKATARGALDALAAERKLDDKQKAFVEKRFGSFQTQAADDAALKTDLGKFLDGQLTEYADMQKLFGVSASNGESGKFSPPADNGGDLTDPKNNPFIPQ